MNWQSVRNEIRQTWLLVRYEAARRSRSLRSESLGFFVLTFGWVFFLFVVVGRLPVPGYETVRAAPGAYVFGQRFAEGETTVATTLGGAGGVIAVSVVYTVGMAEVSRDTITGSELEAHLVGVPTRVIVLGEYGAQIVTTGGSLVALLAVASVAFAVGAGMPSLAVTGTIAAVGLVCTVTSCTYAGALLIERGSVSQAWMQRLVRPVKFLALAVVAATLWRGRRSIALLGDVPVFRWYVDLALLPVAFRGGGAASASSAGAVGVSLVGAVAAVAVTGVGIVVPLGVATRVRERLRYSAPPEQTDSTETTDWSIGSPTQRVVSRVVSRPVAVATRTQWLRFRREPVALLYVVATAGLLVAAADVLVDRFPGLLLPIVGVYGAVICGTGATLNPLGNEGNSLPLVLTTERGHRHLLAGYLLSTAIPAAAIVGSAVVVAGVVTASSPVTVALATVLGIGLTVAGAAIGLGVGTFVPTYQGITVLDTTGIEAPGSPAVSVFVVGLLLLGSPAFVGVETGWPVVGTLASLGIAGVAAFAGFRYAEREFRSFDVDG